MEKNPKRPLNTLITILTFTTLLIKNSKTKQYFKKCIVGCEKCSDSNYKICESCDLGFYITDDNDCLRCKQEGCLNCDLGLSKCRQCFPGYFLSEKFKCEKCSNNCVLCKNKKFCKMCTSFFHLNLRNYQCELSILIILLYVSILVLSIFGFYGICHFFKNLNFVKKFEVSERVMSNESQRGNSILDIKKPGRLRTSLEVKKDEENINKFITFGELNSQKARN